MKARDRLKGGRVEELQDSGRTSNLLSDLGSKLELLSMAGGGVTIGLSDPNIQERS
jgi:hypothetical protein